jgi:hypothetical protein
MRNSNASAITLVIMLSFLTATAFPAEIPYGRGLTEANKERLLIDDMKDVSVWQNGSPDETTLSRSDKSVPGSRFSLQFANKVDHTKGEKNYPIGWPRTSKDLKKARLTDWSGYDFFECWIFAETSRSALPGTPLNVGFYHSGAPRSSSVPLKQVTKGAWSKIVIPISAIAVPTDVRRVQFNISEADYKHGERVDFYIADVVLTRYVDPAVMDLSLQRKLLYASDAAITASFQLSGHQGMTDATAELEIGRDNQRAAQGSRPAVRSGEISLALGRPLEPGVYWAKLNLRNRAGKLIDRKQVEFRVIRSPF